MEIVAFNYDRFTIQAHIEVVSLGHKAKLTGHPDTWYPAEGAEWYTHAVYLVRGKKKRRIPMLMQTRLLFNRQFARELEKAVSEVI